MYACTDMTVKEARRTTAEADDFANSGFKRQTAQDCGMEELAA